MPDAHASRLGLSRYREAQTIRRCRPLGGAVRPGERGAIRWRSAGHGHPRWRRGHNVSRRR